ncbi:hypothetical protein M3O96_21100 [Aquiflexum sp. TKW24L]|nr:hypothetical protein [Aquiflexum sp. TKW24L]MCL6261609.1 hypothetical protein [Aquiflexum sp. TKW24L]
MSIRKYAKRLSQSGLDVQENLFVKTLDPAFVLRHVLPENEVNFIVKKEG